MRRVVVVGGGFCGLNAVLHLQEALRERRRAELVLVDAEAQFVFTPLLGGVIAGLVAPHRAVSSLRELIDPSVVRLVQDRVEHIDHEHQELHLAGGGEPLPYDSLALTVGSVPLPYPGQEVHSGAAHTTRGVEGALELRRALMAGEGERRRLVVMGGGCVGVELAGTLATAQVSGRVPGLAGLEIVLLEGGARLIGGMHESISAEAYRALVALGVDVRLGHEVEAVEPGQARVRVAAGVSEAVVAGDAFVWCGGVRAPALLERSGLPVGEDGRVQVDSTLRVAELGEVYVGGDAVLVGGTASTRRIDVAIQHARILAGNLLAGSVGRARRDWLWQPTTEVVNLGGGRVAAVVRGVPLRGRLAAGVWHAQLALMAPSLAQRLAVAADAGGALLDSASRWLAARRSGRASLEDGGASETDT